VPSIVARYHREAPSGYQTLFVLTGWQRNKITDGRTRTADLLITSEPVGTPSILARLSPKG
jgi:hypothetical protein